MIQKYKSPIRFFEASGMSVSELATQANKAKKIVQAEFATAEQGFIELDGHIYNKQELLTFLNHPNLEEEINFHSNIWKYKSLLDFLEQDIWDQEQNSWEMMFHQQGFVKNISPYVAHSFLQVSRYLLQQQNLELLASFMHLDRFIVEEDKEAAYSAINNYINEQYKVFKNLNTETYLAKTDLIAPWTSQMWYDIFNRLPNALDHLIDDFTRKVTDFLVDIQHIDRSKAVHLAYNLSRITRLDYEMTELTKSNYEALVEKPTFTGTRDTKQNKKFYWMYVAFILFFLFRVLRACSNDNTNTGTINWNKNTPFQNSVDLDSLQKNIHLSLINDKMIRENNSNHLAYLWDNKPKNSDNLREENMAKLEGMPSYILIPILDSNTLLLHNNTPYTIQVQLPGNENKFTSIPNNAALTITPSEQHKKMIDLLILPPMFQYGLIDTSIKHIPISDVDYYYLSKAQPIEWQINHYVHSAYTTKILNPYFPDVYKINNTQVITYSESGTSFTLTSNTQLKLKPLPMPHKTRNYELKYINFSSILKDASLDQYLK